MELPAVQAVPPGPGRGVVLRSKTDAWVTPLPLIAPLGQFDLDPCATPEPRPWPTAARHIARPENGFTSPWEGRVWLNPPYSAIGPWVGKLAVHGHGTALIFARTETSWFVDYVWAKATALLFLHGRIRFCRANGKMASENAPAPSVFVAYGRRDAEILANAGFAGTFVDNWTRPGMPRMADLFGDAA